MTHYYYKDVDQENDQGDVVKVPIPIDNLFMSKLDLSTGADVPKDKEVGMLEGTRDLSNLFEFSSDSRPSVAMVGGDYTYYHANNVNLNSKSATIPRIVSVSKSKINVLNLGSRDIISQNQKFTVPEQYRDRWMFYSVTCYYVQGGAVHSLMACGEFIPPGTVTYTSRSPRLSAREISKVRMRIDLHIPEIEASGGSDADKDLSQIYADKGEVLSEWWQQLVFFSGKQWVDYYADDDHIYDLNIKITGLPKAEFQFKAIGCYWYHSDFMCRTWANKTKPKDSTTINFNVVAPGYAYCIGIPEI